MKKIITLIALVVGFIGQANGTTITIYFVNGANWPEGNVYAHYWNEANKDTQTTEWPGVAMTKTSTQYFGVECVYSLTINTEELGYTPDNVIFSNHGSSQTASQAIVNGKNYTYFIDADLYLPNSLNNWNGSDENYKSRGINDGTQDIYQFSLSSATLGNNDFYFRLKFSDYGDPIRPYNNGNDFTYSFTNGQWETHESGHSGYFGTTGSFKIAHSTEKASEYRITVYAKKGTGYWVKVELVSKPVSVSAGKATFNCDRALNFSGTGVNAYMITGANAGLLTTSEAMTLVPANTPLYLEGSTANVPVVETSTASEVNTTGNMLVAGTNAAVTEISGAYTNFILTNKTTEGSAPLRFYKANNNTVPANKAYLQIPTASVGARQFFWFDDEVEGINPTHNAQSIMDNDYFNLAGQRVAQPTKGLYIVNGKKVVIK